MRCSRESHAVRLIKGNRYGSSYQCRPSPNHSVERSAAFDAAFGSGGSIVVMGASDTKPLISFKVPCYPEPF